MILSSSLPPIQMQHQTKSFLWMTWLVLICGLLVSAHAEIVNATQTILREANQTVNNLSSSQTSEDIERSIPSDEIFNENPQSQRQTTTELPETGCDEETVTESPSQDNVEETNFAAASEGVDMFIPIDTAVNIPEVIEPLVEIAAPTEPVDTITEDLVVTEAEEQATDPDVSSDSPVTNKSSIHVGNDTAATEDEIPSFSEWTQKVLAEEKSGSNGNTSSTTTTPKISAAPKLRQKNYASPDCGSKILGFNPEAQHASAVLDSSRDEYLLSICSTKIWFVIELCEAIRASKVEIANFELFSSSPKDFRVLISDRYPTRDWTLLGQFSAADERSIQSFSLEQHHVFGKFVKVEVDSHYGTEHYCPISLFRVYGTSEYEVLDIDESRSTHDQDDDGVDDDATKEDMLDDGSVDSGGGGAKLAEPSNLSSSIKNAVISIVKNVVENLVKRDEVESKDTADPPVQTEEAKAEAEEPTKPHVCHTAAVENVVPNVTNAINSSLSCQWEELKFLASLTWLRSDHLNDGCMDSHRTYYSKEIHFARSVWGPATINALCHWIRMWRGESRAQDATNELMGDNETMTPVKEVTEAAELLPANENSSDIDNLALEQLELEHVQDVSEDIPAEMAASVEGNGSPKPVDSGAESKVQLPTPSNGNGGGAFSVQQKESVFVRLSNRIKSLERNMSLSSQYLEELSRRYKRQVDDMQKSLNRTLKSLNDTLQRMAEQDESYKVTLVSLQGEIEDLKSYVRTVQEENLVLRTQIVERHLFLMILEVLAVLTVVMLCLNRFGHDRAPRAVVDETPASTPPPPAQTPPPDRKSSANLHGGSSSKIEELGADHRRRDPLTIRIGVDELDAPSKPSPTPSLADSSSSGCESAFSFPNSTQEGGASRDPSPTQPARDKNGFKTVAGKRSKKKRKLSLHQDMKAKGQASPPKIRLKSDNWEWHSRAKVLAAAFIKENYEAVGMRSSL